MNGPERVGPIVYQGMTTVLTASRDFSAALSFRDGEKNEKHYAFDVQHRAAVSHPCGHCVLGRSIRFASTSYVQGSPEFFQPFFIRLP